MGRRWWLLRTLLERRISEAALIGLGLVDPCVEFERVGGRPPGAGVGGVTEYYAVLYYLRRGDQLRGAPGDSARVAVVSGHDQHAGRSVRVVPDRFDYDEVGTRVVCGVEHREV